LLRECEELAERSSEQMAIAATVQRQLDQWNAI
jgi:hypothetical protein